MATGALVGNALDRGMVLLLDVDLATGSLVLRCDSLAILDGYGQELPEGGATFLLALPFFFDFPIR